MPMDHTLAWLVGGDFNEILFESEKQGGRPRPIVQLQGFRNALQDCQLQDLQQMDGEFTWYNKRSAESAVFERLDRFVGNLQWQNTFQECEIRVLDFFGSDHRPVLCTMKTGNNFITKRKRGRFHWEDKWMIEKNFVPELLMEWENLGDKDTLPEKLGACEKFLRRWAGSRFDQLGKQILQLREKRQQLMGRKGTNLMSQSILEISQEIERAVEKETSHWQQRARLNWLRDGDRNSKVFHAQATERRKHNAIHRLLDDLGQWQSKEDEKARLIMRYFEALYQTSRPPTEAIEEVTNFVKESISLEQFNALSGQFTADEVKAAVFDIHPSKSPGPDGFTGRFYQNFWPAIGDFITQEALGILNEGASIQEWNETIIALIPKVDRPTQAKE